MTRTVRGLPLKTLFPLKAALGAACLALAVIAAAPQPALAQSVDDQLQRLQRELSDQQRQD
jgi:hypothetical protein